ncbi:MAG TPA: acetyl-CoA carboxylase carboxyltransferase subunit beta [Clostridiales bacterium]|nr:acetyl-CoA carboxylase carboxyltransferase subunit beta [Clostridiales bacterium]
MNFNPFRAKKYAVSNIYRARPQEIQGPSKEIPEEEKPNVPQGIMTKCPNCYMMIYTKNLDSNYNTCKDCGYHFRISAKDRLEMLLDKDTFQEYDKEMVTKDPLDFPDYGLKLDKAREKTGLYDGVIVGKGRIAGLELMIAVMEPEFFMGSMGTVIGEKLTRLLEEATKEGLPVVVFTASGGARMQEGIMSLMQMAKVSGAVARHKEAGLLYLTVLTDPTTGGVTASFAMLGDIILAEPGALIGFAGPRVIEQTIGQKLPEGFQRSEFLLEHGFIDKIVTREDLRDTLTKILKLHDVGIKS